MPPRLRVSTALCLLVTLAASLLSGCGKREAADAAASQLPRVGDALALHAPSPSIPVPRAVAPETEHHFGRLEVYTRGAHAFVVRNEGDAPLTLELDETSCKCTAAQLESAEVPPGGSTVVRLEWLTGIESGYYRQWALVKTNDPQRRQLMFSVTGTVRRNFHFEPAEIAFGELTPDVPSQAETLLLADTTTHFTIENVSVSDSNFVADWEPLAADELAEHGAVAGYRLRLQSPTGIPTGDFQHEAEVMVQTTTNPGESERHTLQVPVSGRMLGRIGVFGPEVDMFGRIGFGTRRYGEGAIGRLRVVVRDADPVLRVRQFHVEPDFVKVELRPVSGAKGGLYDLVVEVPPDTKPCSYRAQEPGMIGFDFDHPRIPKLKLGLHFTIRPPQELY